MNTSIDNKQISQSNTSLMQKLAESAGKGTKIIKEANNSTLASQRSRNYKFKVTSSNSKQNVLYHNTTAGTGGVNLN